MTPQHSQERVARFHGILHSELARNEDRSGESIMPAASWMVMRPPNADEPGKQDRCTDESEAYSKSHHLSGQ